MAACPRRPRGCSIVTRTSRAWTGFNFGNASIDGQTVPILLADANAAPHPPSFRDTACEAQRTDRARRGSTLAQLARLVDRDLGGDDPGLLPGPDAHGLAAVDDGDGVGRGAPADPPGQQQVAPLVVGRRPLGDDPPVAAGREEGVDVLHQHGRSEAAQLAHRRLGGGTRQQAGGLAPAGQRLERGGARRSPRAMTSAWGPAAMASATSAVTSPPMATTPPKADCTSHSSARRTIVTSESADRRRTGWRA